MPIRKSSIIATYLLITFTFILTIQNANVSAGELIGVSSGLDDINITSQKMTLKINDYKPDFTWWHLNTSSNLEAYNIRFTKIQEYFGTNDDYLDSVAELGGLSYNLQTGAWDYTITDEPFNVIVNLTLSGLANDASIQFIIHISTIHYPLNHTNDYVIPFSAAKIEIKINNWKFTPGARGIAIKSEQFESLGQHQIFYENDTTFFGPNMDSVILNSFPSYSIEKSYYKWVTVADYYNSTYYEDTLDVGKAFFNDTYTDPDEERVHLWFSYPKVNDSLLISHFTVLGLFDQSTTLPITTNQAALYLIPIIGLSVSVNLLILFVRKKHKN